MAWHVDGQDSCDYATAVPSQDFSSDGDCEDIANDLAPGTTVGEYVVDYVLGRGGFGTVYRASHPLIGKEAAIKVLALRYSANPEMVSRFVEEARAVNTIRHTNIIDIFSIGQLEDSRRYFVMELLDGAPLDAVLDQQGPLEPNLAVSLLRGVSRALDAAHASNIIHRDLKPENIFLVFDEDGQPTPKLLDFGIAKLQGDEKALRHKTRSGVPIGTPAYMAPEQCLGLEVDYRTDVYAFGVVCFQVLTGERPFSGQSYLELLTKQSTAERPLASAIHPDLGTDYDATLQAMMAIDKEARPQSVGEAWQRLRTAAGIPKEGGTTPTISISMRDELRVAMENARTMHDLTQGATRGLPVPLSQVQRAVDGRSTNGGTTDSSRNDSQAPQRQGGGWSMRFAILGGSLLAAAAVYSATGNLSGIRPAASQLNKSITAPTASETPTATPSEQASAVAASSAAPAASAAPSATLTSASLSLSSNARGAVAFMGEKRLGKLPDDFTLNTESGTSWSITVRAPGYIEKSVDIEVAAEVKRKIVLKPKPRNSRVSNDLEDPGI